MNDEKPTITAWNMENESIHNSPEMQRPVTPTMNAVANSMASDVRVRHNLKWYVNVPMIFIILVIGRFVSPLLGLFLISIALFAIISSIASSPKSPHKTSSIIGWVVFYTFLALLIIV